MALESNRRRDWDGEAVHPRTVRLMASPNSSQLVSSPSSMRSCCRMARRVLTSTTAWRRTFCPSPKDIRRCQSMVTCRRQQRVLVRNVKKRVFFSHTSEKTSKTNKLPEGHRPKNRKTFRQVSLYNLVGPFLVCRCIFWYLGKSCWKSMVLVMAATYAC